MGGLDELVVFLLDDCRYGLTLAVVEKVIPMVEITPLPKAPAVVMGIVNMQGRLIPICSVRRRFGLPDRDPDPKDYLVIADTPLRTVGLAVDEAFVMAHAAGEIVDSEAILPGLEYVKGIVKLEDGMILIHDLDQFLSIEEEDCLSLALRDQRGGEP